MTYEEEVVDPTAGCAIVVVSGCISVAAVIILAALLVVAGLAILGWV